MPHNPYAYIHSSVDNFYRGMCRSKVSGALEGAQIAKLKSIMSKAIQISEAREDNTARSFGMASADEFVECFNHVYENNSVIADYIEQAIIQEFNMGGKDYTGDDANHTDDSQILMDQLTDEVRDAVDDLIQHQFTSTGFKSTISGILRQAKGKQGPYSTDARFRQLIGETTNAVLLDMVRKFYTEYSDAIAEMISNPIQGKMRKPDVVSKSLAVSVKNYKAISTGDLFNTTVHGSNSTLRNFLEKMPIEYAPGQVNALLYQLYNILYFESKDKLSRDQFYAYKVLTSLINYTAYIWLAQGTSDIATDSKTVARGAYDIVPDGALVEQKHVAGYIWAVGHKIVKVSDVLKYIQQNMISMARSYTNTSEGFASEGIRATFLGRDTIMGSPAISDMDAEKAKYKEQDNTIHPPGGDVMNYGDNVYGVGNRAFAAYEGGIKISLRLKMRLNRLNSVISAI
jgi:hypothetical protein